jgi:4-amino-4-deoxy-L-arabinose transferase-like glycosyltransferase
VQGLLALTALRLAVAGVTALSPDETYYWVWSKALAWGYPDHPPMVALWIRAGTFLAGDGALGVRLLGPLATLLGSFMLARTAEDLFPGRGAGPRAAVLMNATLFLGVGAITMTPDTPLLFFWMTALWAVARAVSGGRPVWWLAGGLAAGLALDSKYTAILLLGSLGLWLVATPAGREWLRRPWPWLGLAIAVACFAPVVAWNADHDWVSFVRQGGRAGAWQPARAAQFLSELVVGQVGLATPIVAWLGLCGMAALVRRWRETHAALILALVLLPGAVFAQHALGDRVQGNWPAVIWPGAVIAGALLSGRLWRPAAALGFALAALIYVQATLAPLALPITRDPTLLRLAGWRDLARQVEQMRAANNLAFVASDQYGIASELAHAMPGAVSVVAAGDRWTLFRLPQADRAGQAGLLVQTERQQSRPDPAPWQSMEQIGEVERSRNGMVAERFRLWRVVARASPDLVQLPRPGRD